MPKDPTTVSVPSSYDLDTIRSRNVGTRAARRRTRSHANCGSHSTTSIPHFTSPDPVEFYSPFSRCDSIRGNDTLFDYTRSHQYFLHRNDNRFSRARRVESRRTPEPNRPALLGHARRSRRPLASARATARKCARADAGTRQPRPRESCAVQTAFGLGRNATGSGRLSASGATNIKIRQWLQISNPQSNRVAVMDTSTANRLVLKLFEKTFPQLSNYPRRELSHDELLAATYVVRDPINVLLPRMEQTSSATQEVQLSLSTYSPSLCRFSPHFKQLCSDRKNKSKCLALHLKSRTQKLHLAYCRKFQTFPRLCHPNQARHQQQ